MLVRVKERLLGEGVRGLIKSACCRVAGEETFGNFCLSEGKEGEEGSLNSRFGWLNKKIFKTERMKAVTFCLLFVQKRHSHACSTCYIKINTVTVYRDEMTAC